MATDAGRTGSLGLSLRVIAYPYRVGGRGSVFSLFFGRDATRKPMTANERRFCHSPVLQGGQIGQQYARALHPVSLESGTKTLTSVPCPS